MSSPALRIGRLPPIRVGGGTVLTVVLLAALVYPGLVASGALGRGGALGAAVAVGLSVIGSVLVHELAHALLARAFGGQVELIALTLWGGHTQYRAGAIGPWASMAISLAGPASNALLALMLHLLAPAAAGSAGISAVVGYGVVLNLGLAVFNLLPGLPMDGGRAVEALLGAVLRRPVLATVITAWAGRVIAVVVVAGPVIRVLRGPGGLDLFLLLWSVIIASTLWQGAGAALREARTERRLGGLRATALAHPVRVLPARASVADLRASGVDPAAVLLLEGTDARRLDPTALASVPVAAWPRTPLAAVARAGERVVVVRDDADGSRLAAHMVHAGARLAVVVDARGDAVGQVSTADLAAALDGPGAGRGSALDSRP